MTTKSQILDLTGTSQEIIDIVSGQYPEIEQLIFNAHIIVPKYKGSIQPYQAAVLYMLAKDYNYGDILEIGTGVGYSTFFLANACPNAKITTVNPNDKELSLAKSALNFSNVFFWNDNSRNTYNLNNNYDFIFIDGDHNDIEFDLNWYYRLNEGGTILFHDYTDIDSHRPQSIVYDTLNKYQDIIGDFNIFVKDTKDKFGMCGWIRSIL